MNEYKLDIQWSDFENLMQMFYCIHNTRYVEDFESVGIKMRRNYDGVLHIDFNKQGQKNLRLLDSIVYHICRGNDIKIIHTKRISEEDLGELEVSRNEFKLADDWLFSTKIPEGLITVSEFCTWINQFKESEDRKNISPVELNNILKRRGVLEETLKEDGGRRTILNEKSEKYGFTYHERKKKDGEPYSVIVMNDIGKKYTIEVLESSWR